MKLRLALTAGLSAAAAYAFLTIASAQTPPTKSQCVAAYASALQKSRAAATQAGKKCAAAKIHHRLPNMYGRTG
jgi:hypothetical protein